MSIGYAAIVLAGAMLLAGCIRTSMPGRSFDPAAGAPQLPPPQLVDALRKHLQVLAVDIGRRHMGAHENLTRAAAYLETTLQAAGFEVRSQRWQEDGKPVRNLEVEVPGNSRPDEVILMGAHYDAARQSPGADDNGSGVAALIEVARAARELKPDRTLRFVFFVNEEPPFFAGPRMGSWHYARAARHRNDDLRAVIALDSIGRFSSEPGSQRYPAAVADKFPKEGNFLAFVTRDEDFDLLGKSIGAFRQRTPVPSEGAAMPSFVEGVWYSDHWSFWQFGYPGIMITDTAFFRWKEYHTPDDTIDRLDFPTLAHVTRGLLDILAHLADDGVPLKSAKR